MTRPLLNCDLGEWESPADASALIAEMDLINLACGGHAGSHEQLRHCHHLAQLHGVHCGAHPGTAGHKGRSQNPISPSDFLSLLQDQISYFQNAIGKPAHLKLHGGLYHLSERETSLRDVLLRFCEDQELPLIAFAGGVVATEAKARALPLLEESFLDRRTGPDGRLIPRDQPNAILSSPQEVLSNLSSLKGTTLCLHSDSPNSLQIAKAVRLHLDTRTR